MFGTIAHKPQAIPFDKLKKAIFSDKYGKIQTRILQFAVRNRRVALHQVSREVMKGLTVMFLHSAAGHKTEETNKILLTHFLEDISMDLNFPK